MIHEERWEELLDAVQSQSPGASTALPSEILAMHEELVEQLLTYLGCAFRSEGGWTEISILGSPRPIVVPGYSSTLPDPKILGYLSETIAERSAFDSGGNEALAEYRKNHKNLEEK